MTPLKVRCCIDGYSIYLGVATARLVLLASQERGDRAKALTSVTLPTWLEITTVSMSWVGGWALWRGNKEPPRRL